jgi:FAD/FMN-containing dehydrogenase
MNKVIQVNGMLQVSFRNKVIILLSGLNIEDDGDMIVQSGITWEDVNKTLAERGIPLFFPVSRPIMSYNSI